MKLNRREFLKRGGLLAMLGAIPNAVTTSTQTVGEHIKERIVRVYRKTSSILFNAPGPGRGRRVTAPVIDLWVAADHFKQHLSCTCEYSLDGKCLHACDEGLALARDMADSAGDLWILIAKHIKSDTPEFQELRAAWRRFMYADDAYRRHYCTGWVGEESVDG